ncbi:MAG TPA: hypothetical protein PLX35_02935 [Cyclobacteriaceae bacterium]|nr:hypothetical protein [Cyclobacteriaceae bacterium]
MKICLLLFALIALSPTSFGRENQGLSKNDSTLITSMGKMFETEFMPFARKFAEASYPVKLRSEKLTDAQYRIYVSRARSLTEGFLNAELYQQGNPLNGLNKRFVYLMFEAAYRNNFAGLDFTFFEKTESKLGSVME